MKSAWRGGSLGLLTIACALALIAWNVAPFLGAKPKPRMKDLNFLPSPTVARILSLGQHSTVAKLRWIDSFAYFELMIDRRDDRLAGSAVGDPGGFQRLYDMLIALDPYYEPIYQHAALCTSGILKRPQLAVGYLGHGLLNLPHESALWRHLASVLVVNYQLPERQPEQFHRFLSAWAEAESTPEGRQAVWDWQATMARVRFAGLEEVPYWIEQLGHCQPDTEMDGFITGVLREQTARYGVAQLQALADAYRTAHGVSAATLEDLLNQSLIQRTLGRGLTTWSPIAVDGEHLRLRHDPYGLSYRYADGTVISDSLSRLQFERKLAAHNFHLGYQSGKHNAKPTDLATILAWGLEIPEPPATGTVSIRDGLFAVDYARKPEQAPWTFRGEPLP